MLCVCVCVCACACACARARVRVCVCVCAPTEPAPVVEVTLVPGNNLQLPCSADSNLARVLWLLSDRPLVPGPRYYQYPGGLLLLNASGADAGRYACRSEERTRGGGTHNRTVAVYLLALGPEGPGGPGGPEGPGGEAPVDEGVAHSTVGPDIPGGATATPGPDPEGPGTPETQTEGGRVAGLRVAVAVLALLCLSLFVALLWKVKRGALLRCLPFGGPRGVKAKAPVVEYAHVQNHAASEGKTAGVAVAGGEPPGSPCLGNNNHSGVDFKGNGHPHFTSMADLSCLDGLGYINDESEI